jgi:hypothetical protein
LTVKAQQKAKGVETMANTTRVAKGKDSFTPIREEDLEELEALHRDLLAKAQQAREDGRVYLMSQYVRLVALVSPEIKRIRDRFDREVLASIRKEHKMLKAGQAHEDANA